MNILNKTDSLCEKCLKRIPAETFEKNGRVYIRKNCPEHGRFESLHSWDDPEIYQELVKMKTLDAEASQLAIALTYRCNLNCPVCYARANEMKIPDFKYDDLDKIKGYPVVFLTGGEPTIREDLPAIIRKIKKAGKKVIMFSNGLKLAKLGYVKILKRAGLECVLLQFDSLDDGDIAYIRGRNVIKLKKKALANLQQCQMTVYFCSAMLKNRSLKHLKEIFDYSREFPVVKNLSINELWQSGRFKEEDFVPSSKIIQQVSKINGLNNNDWLESTELLCGLDKFLAVFNPKRRRLFCKCTIKCLVLRHRGKIVPINRIFDTKKINQKIKDLYERKSKLAAGYLLLYLFFNQIFLGAFRNKNIRILLKQLLANSVNLFRGNYFLFNPFYLITVAIFQTSQNMDFHFADQCNFKTIASDDFSFDQGCIYRIKALRSEGNNCVRKKKC